MDIIENANAVLMLFEPYLRFERDGRNRLVLAMVGRPNCRDRRRMVQVSPHSGSLCMKYGQFGMGGTGAMAVGQLARWIRGQTRLPLRTWEYWASDRVKLTNAHTVAALKRLGYDDPAKTCCVLCGSDKVGDWWHLNGKTGPCCSMVDVKSLTPNPRVKRRRKRLEKR